MAEVALHFEHQSADALAGDRRAPVGDQLLRVRVHAAAGLASADGAEDRYAGEESPFRDSQPVGLLGRYRLSRVVNFSEHQEEFSAAARVGVWQAGAWVSACGGPEGKDVEARKDERIADVGVVKRNKV